MPERAGHAVPEVCIAVDGLDPAVDGAHPDLAEELDVLRRLESVEDLHQIVGVQRRQLAVVVGECLVDDAETAAGRCGVDLSAARLHVAPEDDHVAAASMRPGREKVGRRDDRRARPRGVRGDRQLPDHVLLRRPFGIWAAARDSSDERKRTEMDEDVPRVAKDDRIVRAKAVLGRDRHRRCDGAFAHPKPYVPGKRSARSRTRSATGSPTTFW